MTSDIIGLTTSNSQHSIIEWSPLDRSNARVGAKEPSSNRHHHCACRNQPAIAQRDSAQAYIASQQQEGWVVVEEQYDDGGFSGGNAERPALVRLLEEVAAGKIDCVGLYKVGRLSRSLLDFAHIMETFDKHGVAFVSVTQQFNTGTPRTHLRLPTASISRQTLGYLSHSRRLGKRRFLSLWLLIRGIDHFHFWYYR